MESRSARTADAPRGVYQTDLELRTTFRTATTRLIVISKIYCYCIIRVFRELDVEKELTFVAVYIVNFCKKVLNLIKEESTDPLNIFHFFKSVIIHNSCYRPHGFKNKGLFTLGIWLWFIGKQQQYRMGLVVNL